VSGSPSDKSFVILSADYAKVTNGNLSDDATIKFGAPPLVNEVFTGGQAQASLNLWNWNARAKVAGKTQLVSVGELLADLTTRHAGLKAHLYNEQGKLRSFVNVYLNDEDIRYLQKEQTAVKAGDTISIIPSVAGGV